MPSKYLQKKLSIYALWVWSRTTAVVHGLVMRVKKMINVQSILSNTLPLPKFYEKYIDVMICNEFEFKRKKKIFERMPLLESFSNFDAMFFYPPQLRILKLAIFY